MNWLKGPYLALMNELQFNFYQPPLSPSQFAMLLNKLHESILSQQTAKLALSTWIRDPNLDFDILIKQHTSNQLEDSDLNELIDKIIKDHPNQVKEYKEGKTKLLSFFIGLL